MEAAVGSRAIREGFLAYASFFDFASCFGTVFGFDSVSYMHRNRKKKQFDFLVFYTFFD